MLRVFQLVVYTLLNLEATLSFVTLYITVIFYVGSDILPKPFSFSTHVMSQTLINRYANISKVLVFKK